MTGYGNRYAVLKKSMEDELTRRMHSIAFRATKAGADLPSTTDIVRKCRLEPGMKLYQAPGQSYAELSDGEVTITNDATSSCGYLQLTGGFIGSDSSATQPVSTASGCVGGHYGLRLGKVKSWSSLPASWQS